MLTNILNRIYFNNTMKEYIISLSILIFCIILAHIFKTLFIGRMKAWAERTSTAVDDFIIKSMSKNFLPLAYLGSLYFSIYRLNLYEFLRKLLTILILVLVTFYGVRFLLALIIFTLETYWLKKEKDESKKEALKGILTVIRLVVWSGAAVILFDNLGIKISAIVAGLGIGGIAIALAAQAVLGDLFSYFTIFFDRPFEIGDFIIVGEYLGVVEHIGIKTTRIRSLSGEQLVFSNTDLTNSRVRNYKRMEKRRVAFKLGVTYQTGLEKLKDIPGYIRNIIESIDDTEFDRAHFYSYGDFSLIFEIVYYVFGSDYNKYMDIQQEINLRIKDKFDSNGIEFAYPTETIYLNKI